MKWTVSVVAMAFLAAAGPVLAGREVEIVVVKEVEEKGTAAAGALELVELDMRGLVEALKEQIEALDALRDEMQETLEAVERVNSEVAELREQRLDERLNEIADLGPEMGAAVEKLRLLRTRAGELRAELKDTEQKQREAFKALEIGREDKELLKALMSGRELPFMPRERRVVTVRKEEVRKEGVRKEGVRKEGVRKEGGEKKRRVTSEWALRMREHSEQQRKERRRRLDELEHADPELHALMAKKVELLEELDEPRVELAERMEAVQRTLQALHRRLGEFHRTMELGQDF